MKLWFWCFPGIYCLLVGVFRGSRYHIALVDADQIGPTFVDLFSFFVGFEAKLSLFTLLGIPWDSCCFLADEATCGKFLIWMRHVF